MHNSISQLKEVWDSLTYYQKKILSIYFVIGLPWIPMAFFASYISTGKGQKFWPDTIEAKRSDVIMILTLSVASSLFSIVAALLWIYLPH